MTSKQRLLPILVALLIWEKANFAYASLESNALPIKTTIDPDIVKTPVASVMIDEAGARKKVVGSVITDNSSSQRKHEPPGSPVTLFTPDEFQFYTLNKNGQLVMKQMTKQEIQGMIAAGGTGLPVDLGHHQTQLPDGEPKVADVVQNVQNVLKGELNKPVQVPSSSSSSIPNNVNNQWTNMLPYILSGGSADQQDIADDTSIILPTLDDQSYVDVVPLLNGKPTGGIYETGPNYAPALPNKNEEEIKLVTRKPVISGNEKPIYMLGNMALDSGILGEQEEYTVPIKKKPTRPQMTSTISPMYQKFTTSRPFLDNSNSWQDSIENSHDGKPTLYIPLSVSSSLLADSQNKDNNYGQFGGVDQRLPSHASKPSQLEKNDTKTFVTQSPPPKKISTTTYTYSDEVGFTRVPMIQVPVIDADKIISSTQKINQPATFEILPTVSSETLGGMIEKNASHPTKINLGPMGGFKKPGTGQRPTTSYRPIYEPMTKPTTDNLSSITYRPVYEPVNKPSTSYKTPATTYRPVYNPLNKLTTQKSSTATYRPVYEPVTKPSSRRPVFETSTRLTTKVTQFPSSYTTGKASTSMFEHVTKPSSILGTTSQDTTTRSAEKVTSIPFTTQQVPSKVPSASQVAENVELKTDKVESSTKIITIDDFKKTSIVSQESTQRLPETTVVSEKVTYSTDKSSEIIPFTTPTVKVEDESDIRTTVSYMTEKTTQEQSIDMTTMKQEPVKTVEQTTIPNDSTYQTTIHQKETTNEPEETFTTVITEIKDDYETMTPLVTSKPQYLNKDTTKKTEETWMTTKFRPVEETTTYDSDNVKKIFVKTQVNSETTEYPEIVTEDSTLIDKFVESTQNYNDPLLIEAINSIIGGGVIESKQPTRESVTEAESDEMTTLGFDLKSESDISSISKTESSPLITYKTTQTSPMTLVPEITTEKVKVQSSTEPSQTEDDTTVYQKIEMITNGASSTEDRIEMSTLPSKQTNAQKQTEEKPTTYVTNGKVTIPIQEDEEVSTIKVIPIYDDDETIYTYPPENVNKIISTLIPTTNKPTDLPDSSVNKNTQYMPIQQTNVPVAEDTTPSITVASLASTTQIPNNQETVLPGLEETFNNYMKEHYDPKLSPTGNYDEISQMTTFSTIIEKSSSNDADKSSVSSSMLVDDSKTDSSDLQTKQEPVLIDISTIVPAFESTIIMKDSNLDQKVDSTTQNIAFEKSQTTEYPEEKQTLITSKYPEATITNKIETPIIYLDVTNSNVDKQDNSHMSDSSMTRIKTKNPVLDIDKIISDAQAQTNMPATESYTLPTDLVPPNNIASGLIAGYPTYTKEKPIMEYMPTSTLYDLISGTDRPKINEPQEDEVKISATLPPSKDESKTSSQSTSTPEDFETSTTVYETSETTNYDSYTQIPFEKLPIVGKPIVQKEENMDQMNTSFNPPLEKINDLINQLKNTPSVSDSIGYDYSNGIATTIVPLDKFGTIINESNATPSDVTLTTILDSLTKTSTESRNNTYVVIQTLPSSEPFQTSTESLLKTTTKAPNTQKATTQSTLKSEPTTVLTIVEQSTTGKPLVTTTFSTTKGSLEKIQSTIDKSAGRINLEEEKTKIPLTKPTEPSKFTMKNKYHYSTLRRPVNDLHQGYTRKTTRPLNKGTLASSTIRRKPTSTTTTSTTTTTTTSTTTTTTTTAKPVDEDITEKWTLIPQKSVPEENEESKKVIPLSTSETTQQPQLQPQIVSLDHASGAIGLDQSNKDLDKDVADFLNMCNELSFRFWTAANSGLSSSRSVTLSPFGMISTLAMIFLGARGLTSNAMNDILKLDDVVTFNPHLVFQNITDTVTLARGQGIENAAFVRALFADRLKVRKIMPFYKEQAQQFYEGAVVDINFSTAGDILRRRTNLLIRKQTGGRIKDFVKGHTVPLRSPLTALSANVFQTSCDSPDASSEGRDGEMYFAVSQTVKQRKLVPIPAVVWKSGVSAGYEPSLDATAVALGDAKRPVSLIMVMPGQQGLTAPGDNLDRLEYRLFGNPGDNALEKLLKVIIPRRVEVQMPKFSHRSIFNITAALKKMGFDQLLTRTADLKGINGAGHDLYLSEMIQMNLFDTCADDNKLGGSRLLSETYPGSAPRHTRAWEILNNINNGVQTQNEPEISEPSEDTKCEEEETSEEVMENSSESGENSSSPGKWSYDRLRQKLQKNRLRWLTSTRPRRKCRTRRQTEPEKPRMKMDKPFLYLIRHNLTGLILHIGRFNPKSQS